MRLRLTFVLALTLAALSAAFGQAWSEAYSKALDAVRAGEWDAARAGFTAAIAARPEDQSNPTTLPGSVTEPVRWRDGAPYSPNFGLAYSSFRQAQAAPDAQRAELLNFAATGFETLIAKNQGSTAAFFFLNKVYGLQNRPDKQRELETSMRNANAGWKVDSAVLTPEENAEIASLGGTSAGGRPQTEVIRAGQGTTPGGILKPVDQATQTTAVAGRVPIVADKFALVIGNSQGQIPNASLPFAASDAMLVRDGLVQNAGYDDRNVDVVVDATADQILIAARALASRMPNDARVFVFFSGVGANVDGKDYYAGVTAVSTADIKNMVAKDELFQTFFSKGARVFAFHQANRPVIEGRYFGMEIPLIGSVAQMHAVMPGSACLATTSEGRVVGIFTKALLDVMSQVRSNTLAVTEFGWQVFNSMRGGRLGVEGGGIVQVPTLPVVRYMSPSSPF